MVIAEFDGNFAEMKSKYGGSVVRHHQEANQTREPNFYHCVGFVKATLTLLTIKNY